VFRRVAVRLARLAVGLIATTLIVIGIALSVLETGWAKDRLRGLMVRQANEYLTVTLTIGRFGGSLFRGLEFGDVKLSRDGKALVTIDELALSYSLRELFESGTVIRRVRLTRPRFFVTRTPEGRWDLAAIVKRERREGQQTGPNRPIVVQRIDIEDGRVVFNNPLDFGAAHAPTDFDALNATLAFAYYPVRWRLDFERLSFTGRAPDLTISALHGGLGNGPAGWFFDKLSITTPRSAYTIDGRVVRGDRPTELQLDVHAARFAFQEWSGVLRGLKNIAVESAFDAALKGPLARIGTDIRLAGTGGTVSGHLVLDTTIPGWRGAGTVDVGRLNLARWLNDVERPSDVTGRVTFDLALELGRHFPRGVYTFDGPHAMYMNYAADNLKARGQLTSEAVLVGEATASAYGARVSTHDASIGIDAPHPYRFRGSVTGVDLRHVPATVPVPHVDSRLTFDYDVTGRFSHPYIAGNAVFGASTFLGASIAAGTVGTIDTQETVRYTGDGVISQVDLRRFGEGLDVAWLRDPRYAGTIAGRFRVEGSGTDRRTLTLTASGRLARAELFRGVLGDADVTMAIERGTLRATYTGRFSGLDPAIPFDDERWRASLTGSGSMTATVHDLLLRDVTTADYDVTGSLALDRSTVRDIAFDRARVEATLRDGTLTVAALEAAGPTVSGRGSGTLALDDDQSSSFAYDISAADLARLAPLTGVEAAGSVATKGRLSGPWASLRAAGSGTIAQLDAFNVRILTVNGAYDVMVPADVTAAAGHFDGRASFASIAGQALQEMSGTVAFDNNRFTFDVRVAETEQRTGSLAGTALFRPSERSLTLLDLRIALGKAPWRLESAAGPPTISWDDAGVTVTPLAFAGSGDERIRIAGTWRTDGAGSLRVTAAHVFLDTLQSAFDRPTRYGGVLDADVTIRGTRDRPEFSSTLTVTNGRVERVSYQTLAGRVDYAGRVFTIDVRLDQSAGVWITARGSVPLAFVDQTLPAQPMDVAITSSGVNLGLIEGVTNLVRHVSGELRVDVRAIGTTVDPHFTGTVRIDGGAFDVAASGAKYKNARVDLGLSADRIAVNTFHVEDTNGRPLDLRGSLGTHELRVGDLEIEISTRRFEVLRNEFGRVDLDAALQLRGRFEAPLLSGELTIGASELRVDRILERALFQPYSIEPTSIVEVDPVAALNPWQRLGMNLIVRVPNTLRLLGDNVQVSPGTPIGLGDINLRVAGDLSLYKDASEPLYVNGAFDQVSGTYAFQGRRFDVDPVSSIVFRGDLNPDVYIGVTRDISGVQVRVGLVGPLRQPELRLSSVPPLEESDVLSLVVFNTSTNLLTSQQQQDLVVRAGALAAGFLATPLVSAISNQIGLDVLELEPGDELHGLGAKVTIGEEIAPGLVARFSRQFGPEPYDEATIEYYLSQILRLRATFSDVQTQSRSPFRRIERAGLDLLFFFSF
jgi:hypothetical protein